MSDTPRVTEGDEIDVAVIGGGIAGCLAAFRAAQSGASVVIINHPMSATAQSSGAIDVADELHGDVPGLSQTPPTRGAPFLDAATALGRRMPHHPYARPGALARFGEALAALREMSAERTQLQLVAREDGKNHVVATQVGTLKRAAYVQASQHLDVLSLDSQARVVVVELPRLGGFTAPSVVDTLNWLGKLTQLRATFVAGRATPLSVGRVFDDAKSYARALDSDPALVTELADVVRKAFRASEATHLLMPGVCGIERHKEVHRAVADAIIRPVGELLSLPPSAPGERLANALFQSTKRRGVRHLSGSATNGVVADGKVRSFDVVTPSSSLVASQTTTLRPKAIVLASGRYFAGGITRDHQAYETLFGWPVVADGAVVGDRFVGQLLGDAPEQNHALFRAGVAVDEKLRPADGRGGVLARNAFCAGTVIAGYDPARDGAAGGVAALTGYLAGEGAARHARG